MSQPSSSTDPSAPRPLTSVEMRRLLQHLYAKPDDASFLWTLSQTLADPYKAGKKGHFRMEPVLAAACAMFAFMLFVFIYFTFVRS